MAVGGLYVARRHVTSSLETNLALTLRPSAERAAIETVAAWDSLARANQPVGTTTMLSAPENPSLWITRTAELEYVVVAEARTSTRPALYHRVALSVVVGQGKPGDVVRFPAGATAGGGEIGLELYEVDEPDAD